MLIIGQFNSPSSATFLSCWNCSTQSFRNSCQTLVAAHVLWMLLFAVGCGNRFTWSWVSLGFVVDIQNPTFALCDSHRSSCGHPIIHIALTVVQGCLFVVAHILDTHSPDQYFGLSKRSPSPGCPLVSVRGFELYTCCVWHDFSLLKVC